MAAIGIVTENRIWFAARHGLSMESAPRQSRLCGSTTLSSKIYIVRDATLDPLTRCDEMVVGDPRVRFYAGAPLKTADGHNLGALCVMDTKPRSTSDSSLKDLADLAALAADRIEGRQAAANAELMAREVNHRVMNSLQFISGLLAIQARTQGSGPAEAELLQAASRIDAVAQVHRHFQAPDDDETSCIVFLRRLCGRLESILGRPIKVTGFDGAVPAGLIQPIGLLVNELVTNAAKHGRGRIDVVFEARPGGFTLTVRDEGDGPPSGFDPWAPGKGLGMQVIRTITRQLGGILTAGTCPGGGGYFAVAFQVEARESAIRSRAEFQT